MGSARARNAGLVVLGPGGANEVAQSCRVVMATKHEPASLILSRQAMPTLDRTHLAPASEVAKGAYVLKDPSGGKPEIILMASGSEVSLCLEACEARKNEGEKVRVIRVPS